MLNTLENSWRARIAAAVLHRSGTHSAIECIERLGGLDSRARAEFSRRYVDLTPRDVESVDDSVGDEERRERGAYFTPGDLADCLVALVVGPDEDGLVVDLSCGDGALLAAVARRAPRAQLLGIDQELEFCAAAAQRLPQASIVWGDGLAAPTSRRAAVVVGNPPYVGEKNNRELFESVRAAHPDLARWFGARMDLHYLFLHRALDHLAPGGRIAYLTSEYWLTATGAGALRGDLGARTKDRHFERLGAAAFDSAPGHHSLFFTATRAEGGAYDEATWHPFAEVGRATEGTLFSEVGQDRQGFVSGADRVTKRAAAKYSLSVGAPVYLWRRDELPAQPSAFRPVLRASQCKANSVVREVTEDWVLWLDGNSEPSPDALAILEPFRELLSNRREAALGTMPWWRVWWPRATHEYARPKLVVPRRSTAAAMTLDLSGALVSSDCTFVLAPEGVDELPWLVRVMLAANSDTAIEQLRSFGKTKGAIMEFYSAPLRSWRLPVVARGATLRCLDEDVEQAAQELLLRL